jgi:hypothetical protein
MIKRIMTFAALMIFSMSLLSARTNSKSDSEIKQLLIKESIAAYKGSCPCPYNTDKAGKSCGARSAYSKPGGASPLCYEKDVTQKMVDDYRKKNGA